jgi:hypothetical protein
MSTAVLAPAPPAPAPLARASDRRPDVQGSTRLTPRGRLVLVALLVAVAFLTLSVGQAAMGLFSAEAGSAPATEAARTWVVQPGQTLWAIAEELDPNTDPRETVARIEAMNDLAGSGLVAGQEIFVPAS